MALLLPLARTILKYALFYHGGRHLQKILNIAAYQLDGLKAQSRGNIETIVRKLSGLTDVNVIVI